MRKAVDESQGTRVIEGQAVGIYFYFEQSGGGGGRGEAPPPGHKLEIDRSLLPW